MKKCITTLMVILYTSILLIGCRQDVNKNKVGEKVYEYNISSYAPYTNYLKDRVIAFNRKYPNVKININDINQGSYISTIEASLNDVEKRPDLVLLDGQELNDLYKANKNIFLDFTSDMSSRTKGYAQGRIDEISLDEKLYGVPWDSRPIIMFCNKALLAKYNTNLDDITTWDTLIEEGKKYYEASGKKENLIVMNEDNEKVFVKVLLYELGIPADSLDMTSGNKDLSKVIDMISELKKNNVLRIDNNFDIYKSPLIFGSSDTYMNLEKTYGDGQFFVKELPSFEPGGNNSVIMEGTNAVLINNKKAVATLKEFVIEALTDKKALASYMTTDGVFPSYVDAYSNASLDKKVQFLDYDRLWARMSLIEVNSKRKKYFYDMSKMIDSYIEQSNKLEVQVNGNIH
ncbi:ABC transporter substrate-binding protein [Clostridium sp. C8-1-8]|uniref:ABC transporter substrate-binding protein n=1 Tax=Clostridium sp. C8-1-8 TaxID=2698831 RepID=UPI00136FE368|nr:ABC transporter substrate-binding protein [Clostridium sp. C8-1-8]